MITLFECYSLLSLTDLVLNSKCKEKEKVSAIIVTCQYHVKLLLLYFLEV